MKLLKAIGLLIISALGRETFTYTAAALITGNIKIVGEPGGMQLLPGSYINTVPRWTAEHTSDQTIHLSKLIGSGIRNIQNEDVITQQFVDPTSNEELWWPADLTNLQVRPTLDVFIKNATPSYILAGLEVRVPSSVSKDGKSWKNFGMNSQPLASQWTSFGIAVENGFRVEIYTGKKQQDGDGDGNGDGNGDEEKKDTTEAKNVEWSALHDSSTRIGGEGSIKHTLNAIGLLGQLLAGMDESSPLSDGMHIVSIPIGQEWTDLPTTLFGDGGTDTYQLVSIGTVEDDAKQVLELDDDLIALSASSVLNVEVSRIAPGGESEYLPQAYVPLYKA